jgi:hypothetical protein
LFNHLKKEKMKNLFIGLLMLAGTASFANNSIAPTGSKLKSEPKKEVKTENERVRCCTASGGGTSVTVCGGGNECRRALAGWEAAN